MKAVLAKKVLFSTTVPLKLPAKGPQSTRLIPAKRFRASAGSDFVRKESSRTSHRNAFLLHDGVAAQGRARCAEDDNRACV